VEIVERLESQVRSYCRSFPVVFDRATGPYLYDVEGKEYIDFFCGAGALNYGHNEPRMKRGLIDYLQNDGVTHALDMATTAKTRFLTRLESVILAPRRLDYRVQFTGPTGANAVEAALKLARKVKRRRTVIAFTGAYHGLSLGALAATANAYYRDESFGSHGDVVFMPFDGYFGPRIDTAQYLRRFLCDEMSGAALPAAIILETIQAEGGVNVAGDEWLRSIAALCRELDILLIVDDIQVGCGRTGTFFSFERAGIEPDIVVLSKSIAGFGLPMSLVLLRPGVDQWSPGEHTGTFRGNNAAFVTAAEALRYWESDELAQHVTGTAATVVERFERLQRDFPKVGLSFRGRGLIYGLECGHADLRDGLARTCFQRGLIIETCGGHRRVLKLLPPLTIPRDVLCAGLDIIDDSVRSLLAQRHVSASIGVPLSAIGSAETIADAGRAGAAARGR